MIREKSYQRQKNLDEKVFEFQIISIAWLSSVRVLKCGIKFLNEQNLRRYYLFINEQNVLINL